MTDDIFRKKKKRQTLGFRVGIAVVVLLYVVVAFAGFLAPYAYQQQVRGEPSAPASAIRFRDETGNFSLRPFIYPIRLEDPLTLKYNEDRSRPYPIEFFVRGSRYDLLGIFSTDLHLFGVVSSADAGLDPQLRLLGSDELGRDRFSRLLYAIRFSLIVTPLGTLLASIIGILIGVVSGYAPRRIDSVLMGAADTMLSLPTLILILAARAAFPLELPPLKAAFLLVTIFAATGWAEIARLARGLVTSIREREFVLAAKASGLTQPRILFRHILPNITGPLITQMTLMFPAFLLYEVALSFLGVGLQEPEPSLGNMLSAAADLTLLRANPVLVLAPAIVIFICILAVRLVSNGLNRSFSDDKVTR